MKLVKVHTCFAQTELRNITDLTLGRLYYTDDPLMKSYKAVPQKCACRQMITLEWAKILIERREAFPAYRARRFFKPLQNLKSLVIKTIVCSQTPRVDLITKADIERAYVDPALPKYIEHIEHIHQMIMEERAKLIVPFKKDPQEGRLLFPFGPDMRTTGGYR